MDCHCMRATRRPEAVDDLLKRVDEYRNKLGGPNRDFGVRSISQET